jgi:hypothetical protein
MKKESVQLNTLPDIVVEALSGNNNHAIKIYYKDTPVTSIHVIRGHSTAAYRINTTRGQFRTDSPEITFTK